MITSWTKDIAHRLSQLADLVDPTRVEKRRMIEMKYIDICSEVAQQREMLQAARVEAEWYKEQCKQTVLIGTNWWTQK